MEMEGAVCTCKVSTKKQIFSNPKQEELFPGRFKHPRTLAVLNSDQRFVNSYWADKGVVVIGASKEIVIC